MTEVTMLVYRLDPRVEFITKHTIGYDSVTAAKVALENYVEDNLPDPCVNDGDRFVTVSAETGKIGAVVQVIKRQEVRVVQ